MIRLESLLQEFYNFSDHDYQSWRAAGRYENIPDPASKTLVFPELIKSIRKAIGEKRHFIVYGDYDCDGITSTAIIVKSLRELGAEVGFFIPSRYKEGYGLSSSRLQQFKDRGYDYLITVDNGITKVEEVKLAKELGFTIAVVDHHEALDTLPPADFIFQQFITGFTDYNVSAAFLAYTISRALLRRDDPYLATLAGIAVLSDLMPLQGANVDLVRLAYNNLLNYQYPNLMCLVNPNNSFDLKTLSYEIIPILNAPGRLCEGLEVNDAVRLLLEVEVSKIYDLAKRLIAINEERKNLVAKEYDPFLIDDSGPIIYFHSKLPVGLGGLIANKIFSAKQKPVVVFTDLPGENKTVGSVRSPDGYDVIAALQQLDVGFDDYGGHQHAAGFTISTLQIGQFKKEFSDKLLCAKSEIKEKVAILLDREDIDEQSIEIISRFEPFGTDHEAPLFAFSVEASSLCSSRTNPAHIISKLNENQRIVFFNGKKRLPSSGPVLLLGALKKNSFNGRETIDFLVEGVGDDHIHLLTTKVDV